MTKPASKRARDHDWSALRREIATPGFHHPSQDYLDALERAIRQREYAPLFALLDHSVPVPPVLLPVLADAIRAIRYGSKARPAEFVSADVASVKFVFELLTTMNGLTQEAALDRLAEDTGRSIDSIKRALGLRKKPAA